MKCYQTFPVIIQGELVAILRIQVKVKFAQMTTRWRIQMKFRVRIRIIYYLIIKIFSLLMRIIIKKIDINHNFCCSSRAASETPVIFYFSFVVLFFLPFSRFLEPIRYLLVDIHDSNTV